MEPTNLEPTEPPSVDIVNRFTNHPPASPEVGEKLDAVTQHMLWVASFIEQHVPPGREQALALTNLEQVSFWTKAGIARHQGV